MKKPTFSERFIRATNFYDFAYHMHKATFKGLGQFYESYSKIEKQYSQQLNRLSKNIWQDMPQFKKQNPTLISTIKQVLSCLEGTCQLHFNYGQKLHEISNFYNSEYQNSKKKKENHMKIIKQRNSDEYSRIREKEKNNRDAIYTKQKQICRQLYDGLEKLAEEENDRIQKIKEQSIIYFSVFKKVCEKEMERAAELNQKLIKQEFQVKNKSIENIAQELRHQHNEYEGVKLDRKSYDVSKTLSVNRDSLRNSLLIKKRMTQITDFQSKVKIKIDHYEQLQGNLTFETMPDNDFGIFDNENVGGADIRRKLSKEIDSNVIRVIAFQMIDSFVRAFEHNSDSMLLLQMMKAHLKAKSSSPLEKPCKSIHQFWSSLSHKDHIYRWHVKFFQLLSEIYQKKCQKSALVDHIQKKRNNAQFSIDLNLKLSFFSCTSILNILLSTFFTIDEGEPYLVEGYSDFLVLISKFSEKFFEIERNVVILNFLRKFMYLMDRNPKQFSEDLEQALNNNYLVSGIELNSENDKIIYIAQWGNNLLNLVTQKFLYFYAINTPFVNYIKIFMIMEKIGIKKQAFHSKEHIYICLRAAGYNYLKSMENSHKLLQTHSSEIGGEERLKNLAEIFEELQYDNFMAQYFVKSAREISKLFGVSEKIARTKFFEQFTYAPLKIAQDNLGIIAEEEGADRNGYALRLGVILGRIDIMNPLPITQYDFFFQVLEKYLLATEKDYQIILEQSRRTQMWIMQENQLATTNCIDFCSLLYKPFQFLLISLNKLESETQTDYTHKFTDFIKLRLNRQLKKQIIKYVKFLYESLQGYVYEVPQLQFKPKRREKPYYLEKEIIEQDKNVFKELTRRMFNLLFLKDQLEEMMCDFLDEETYLKLDNSIFNTDLLRKAQSQRGVDVHRGILTNIREIVEAMLEYEQKIVQKTASITIYHYLRPIFENLYFQQNKNALEQFFSSNAIQLSEYTFLRMQQFLEQWFSVITKNIPSDFVTPYSIAFAQNFYKYLRVQVLNPYKFKIDVSIRKIVPYLQKDVAFVLQILKQRFFDPEMIDEKIKKPFDKILLDMQSESPKLMGMFENATLKNDQDQRKYILLLLNLRAKDQKALNFVKQYKPKEPKKIN